MTLADLQQGGVQIHCTIRYTVLQPSTRAQGLKLSTCYRAKTQRNFASYIFVRNGSGKWCDDWLDLFHSPYPCETVYDDHAQLAPYQLQPKTFKKRFTEEEFNA